MNSTFNLLELSQQLQNQKEDQFFAASIAPSYLLAFSGEWENRLPFLLKEMLGFDFIGETISILPLMIKEQKELLKESNHHFINSSCPKLYKMVLKEFPHLEKYLSPFVSPMIAHGRYLKSRFGSEIKVYFFGPCVEKKREAVISKFAGAVDGVFTFNELKELANQNEVILSNLPDMKVDQKGPQWVREAILHYNITGEAQCRKKLVEFERGENELKITDKEKGKAEFIELLACSGGCLNGEGMKMKMGIRERREKYIEKIKKGK